jgi:hypothetical protein
MFDDMQEKRCSTALKVTRASLFVVQSRTTINSFRSAWCGIYTGGRKDEKTDGTSTQQVNGEKD